MFDNILLSFGLNPSDYTIQPFGSGLINHTLKVSGSAGDYILQQINVNVFKAPEDIAENLSLLDRHFKKTKSDYLFIAPLPATSGDFLVKSASGNIFRLFPFVKGSQTINFISYEKEAFEAAKQFGRFTRLLKEFEIGQLKYTLPAFHDLELRFEQFKTANQNATRERADQASNEIKEVYKHDHILQTYTHLIANSEMPLRIIHHDTKIGNILFDDQQNGLCVIDLDTVMPGYYLSDVGDMMRTYLSPANEEEADLSKIYIRENFFSAVCKGYLSEMGNVLSETEKKYFIFSGKLMIYMQAIRFLTDFLNNDIYYGTKYPGHNLNRARNQFTLLNKYVEAEEKFKQLMIEAERDLSAVPHFDVE
jgi:Ser/Thr protein kinase RdoA (MazF antagonist)